MFWRKGKEVKGKRKLSLMFIAMLILVVMVFAMTHGTALGQDEEPVVADAKTEAGGAKDEAECKDGYIVSKAGGVVAKAPCEPEPPKAAPAPPPPPKAAPAPAPAAKALPPSGGMSTPALIALGAGVLLVGSGLLARRFVR